MAQEIINVGFVPDDGTGDVLRTSFEKVNNNFVEVYTTSDGITSNVTNLSADLLVFEGLIYSELGVCFDTANAAYTFANNQYDAMNNAYTMANTVNSLFYGAVVNAAAAFNMANSTVVRTNAVYTLTNSSYTVANASFNFANNLSTVVTGVIANTQGAFDKANLSFILAGQSYDAANAGIILAYQGINLASAAYDFSNGVSTNTTSAYRVANSGYGVTNVAYGAANAAFFKTNSCYTVTNAAFTTANAKINTVDGIATGTFTVQGTSKVQGPTKLFEVIDGVIYINGVVWNPTPVGTVILSAAQSTPVGYLYANGGAVSRTTYSALFSAIGTTFGPGNGSTTFNLPDLRGTFLRGWDNGRGLDPGRTFGSYQEDGFESHSHSVIDPGHHHTTMGGVSGGLFPTDNYMLNNGQIVTGDSVTGISIGNSGGSETRPKNVALKPFIKF